MNKISEDILRYRMYDAIIVKVKEFINNSTNGEEPSNSRNYKLFMYALAIICGKMESDDLKVESINYKDSCMARHSEIEDKINERKIPVNEITALVDIFVEKMKKSSKCHKDIELLLNIKL